LFYQLTHIRASGHDDIADACADLFHPRVNQLQIFGRQASLFDEGGPMDEQHAGSHLPLLPSELYGDNVIPITGAYDDALSMESPRHDPSYIDEVLKELMEE
jgi:hypothetical protein